MADPLAGEGDGTILRDPADRGSGAVSRVH
jgi:hypothetical protein